MCSHLHLTSFLNPLLFKYGLETASCNQLYNAWGSVQNKNAGSLALKNIKDRAWWHMPVVPATRETEVGGSLEASAQEFEAAVSHDHATGLQPGQQSETLSQKNFYKICP